MGFALSVVSGFAEGLRGAATLVQMEEVSYKGPTQKEWQSMSPAEQTKAGNDWQAKHIDEGPTGPDYLPLLAFMVMFIFPGFCMLAMWAAKPDPKDKYWACEGWGPCLLFGGLVFVLWVYLSIVGLGFLKFHSD